MASRQEEKERRRQERLERERKEAAAASRRKRLQLVGGILLGVILVGGAALAVLVGTGGGGDETEAQAPATEAASQLPKQATSDLKAAAKAAGCTVSDPAIEGANHSTKDFKASDYKTNPPTSGDHFPEWYDDGVYEPGNTPNLGMLVHTLEHGRINVQYKPGTPAATVAELEALLAEQNDGYHMLLYENTTGMKPAVAATAWTHSVTCPEMNDKVFDVIRTFRAQYIDKGPEKVP